MADFPTPEGIAAAMRALNIVDTDMATHALRAYLAHDEPLIRSDEAAGHRAAAMLSGMAFGIPFGATLLAWEGWWLVGAAAAFAFVVSIIWLVVWAFRTVTEDLPRPLWQEKPWRRGR